MKIQRALEIVLELARENQIDEQEARQDPEVLGPIAREQEEALKIIENFSIDTYLVLYGADNLMATFEAMDPAHAAEQCEDAFEGSVNRVMLCIAMPGAWEE
jgi:hypothetical protein